MQDSLRVLLLAPLYAPYVGGAETHVRTLAEALVGLGHRVIVVTDRGHAQLPRSETRAGVLVLRTTGSFAQTAATPDAVRWETGLFGVLRDIEDLLAEVWPSPDVVHVQCQVSFLLGAVLREHFECPLVGTAHETLPEEDGLGRARSQVLFRLPQIDRLVAGSRTFAEQARRLGATGVEVVESSVQVRRTDAGPVARPSRAPWILSVGRFKRRKNQLGLLTAVAALRTRGHRVRCVLVGSCDAGSVEYRDAVLARVSSIGLEADVDVLEGVDDGEVAAMMREADLVVQPALAEGLGLVAVEALLCGATVLATPTDGACEVLGEHPLLLTKGFDPDALALSIEDALARPAVYREQSTRAREAVRVRFDPAVNAARLVSVYRGLMSRTP